jgi:hypothetical protein
VCSFWADINLSDQGVGKLVRIYRVAGESSLGLTWMCRSMWGGTGKLCGNFTESQEASMAQSSQAVPGWTERWTWASGRVGKLGCAAHVRGTSG